MSQKVIKTKRLLHLHLEIKINNKKILFTISLKSQLHEIRKKEYLFIYKMVFIAYVIMRK
jgi:hypothetical protein